MHRRKDRIFLCSGVNPICSDRTVAATAVLFVQRVTLLRTCSNRTLFFHCITLRCSNIILWTSGFDIHTRFLNLIFLWKKQRTQRRIRLNYFIFCQKRLLLWHHKETSSTKAFATLMRSYSFTRWTHKQHNMVYRHRSN